MILHNIFIIITIFIVFKFIFFLLILILKVKHLNKRNENEELASICKTIYLEFADIKEECYIIPTINITKSIAGIALEFRWINIYYSNFWRVITTEQENIYINASFNKSK